jgi:hypothetical protein
MRLDRIDRWLGPSLTLLALAWLWLVLTYIPGARAEGEPGPRAFPILLGAMLAGLGISMAVMALISRRRHVGRVLDHTVGRVLSDPADATVEMIAPLTRREATFAASTFGLLILYAFLLDKVGFVIATPVVMALTMCGLLRMRRWVLIVSLAVGFTLGCWAIFDALLGTPLPRGSWATWL